MRSLKSKLKYYTFVPGIGIPSNLQINNFLNNTLRPRLQGRTGKNKFSYGDLVTWVEANSIVPDNEHEPFVNETHTENTSFRKCLPC